MAHTKFKACGDIYLFQEKKDPCFYFSRLVYIASGCLNDIYWFGKHLVCINLAVSHLPSLVAESLSLLFLDFTIVVRHFIKALKSFFPKTLKSLHNSNISVEVLSCERSSLLSSSVNVSDPYIPSSSIALWLSI